MTALVPGVMTFEPCGKPEEYLAIDRGILVKCGEEVSVSTRNAIRGTDLTQLKAAAEQQFLERAERERAARALEAKLEADLVRGLLEVEKNAESNLQSKLPPAAEKMLREVGVKQERIERGRSRKGNLASSIAILGVVGWSVTVPTVLGVIAGVWIDRHWPSRISWTLTLLLAGLVIGCWNAWLRIEREQR